MDQLAVATYLAELKTENEVLKARIQQAEWDFKDITKIVTELQQQLELLKG